MSELEEYFMELLFSLTLLMELNSVNLVVSSLIEWYTSESGVN